VHCCADASFERALFWRGLYRHAIPLAVFIRWFNPEFFHDDDELIHRLGRDTTMDEVRDDLEHFEYGNRVRRHWLRTGLCIHVSPKRLARLANRCMTTLVG
jgi:hypothetical protein